MENAVDALKIAFGVLVFAIALTLTFSVVGQARHTSEVIFKLNDKTQYYEYTTADDYNAQEDRIVSLETILPTIHRYAKEQYAVTIFDTNGKAIVRYDLYTEGFMGNWNDILKRKNTLRDEDAQKIYTEVEQRLSMVQKIVNNYLGTNENIMEQLDGTLYKGYSNNAKSINIVSPWMGDPNNDTVDRIKADMKPRDTYTKNGITYEGKNLLQYADRKFIEKFIEISTSGETLVDGEDSIETIKGNKKLEIIYILQP